MLLALFSCDYPLVVLLPIVFSASGFRVTCLTGMGFPLLCLLCGRIAGPCRLGPSPTGLAPRGSQIGALSSIRVTVRFLVESAGGDVSCLPVAHWVFGLVCSHYLFLGPRLLACCFDSQHCFGPPGPCDSRPSLGYCHATHSLGLPGALCRVCRPTPTPSARVACSFLSSCSPLGSLCNFLSRLP